MRSRPAGSPEADVTAHRKKADVTRAFDRSVAAPKRGKYVLKLYITGMTPRSQSALANVRSVSEEFLDDCELEVIDIYQQPELAEGEQIAATPTLVKKLPLPVRRLVGDLSQKERVLFGLDLKPK